MIIGAGGATFFYRVQLVLGRWQLAGSRARSRSAKMAASVVKLRASVLSVSYVSAGSISAATTVASRASVAARPERKTHGGEARRGEARRGERMRDYERE